jgi:hypothetical protein
MEPVEAWICANPKCGKPYHQQWKPKRCDKCQGGNFESRHGPGEDDGPATNVDEGSTDWADYQSGFVCVLERKGSLDEVIKSHHGKHGLPDIDTLAAMYKAACGLEVPEIKGRGEDRPKGIHFNIQQFTQKGGKGTVVFNGPVTNKAGSGVCYENSILPKPITQSGLLLVHQGLAPCLLCRNAYRNWAVLTQSTIVVAFDIPYDDITKAGVLIFSPTGHAFLL